MNNSRTKNVLKNMWVGTFFQVISLLIGFVNRTIFIKILSAEYLGINSLFSNILTILSFAELGIGNAIVFNLYKPIANKDEKKINILLGFYKKTYFIIGMFMLVCGTILIPFIPKLINQMPNIEENIYIIYYLFLLDTVISYFFTYRTSIITADQKNYIIVKTVNIFKVFLIILQMVVLYFTHNYYLYIILQLANTLITFLYLSHKSKKMYPYTKKISNEKLPKKEKNEIFKNVRALFINKIGSVVLNGTDSIIISKYISLVALGLYSNYLLIISAITQILSQLLNSFTASIGNLNVEDNPEKKYKIFNLLYYFTIVIFGTIGVCLYVLLNDFVNIWLGKEYLLSSITVAAIVLHFYVNGVQFSTFTYRQTSGLFKEYKYSPIFAVVINIALSIILAKFIGLSGVFFATSITRLVTAGWIDPLIVHKKVFFKSVKTYFLKYLYYILVVVASLFIVELMSNFIVPTNIFMFILKGIIVLVLSVSFIVLFTFKTREFNEIKNMLINYMVKILKRLRG